MITLLRDAGPSGQYCSRRLSEWTNALLFMSFGVELLVLPDLLQLSMFKQITALVTPTTLSSTMLWSAWVRIAALITVEKSPFWSPVLRAVCAAFGAMIWAELGTTLAAKLCTGEEPRPITVPLFLVLALSEVVSAYRAATDARTIRIGNGSNGNGRRPREIL